MAVNILSKNFMSMLSRRGYGPFRSNKLLADLYSTTNSTQTVVADDGRTLVCWHPEPEFPYEQSLPLSQEKDGARHVLKSMNNVGAQDFSHLKGMKEELAREQLMRATFTTKHRWFPRLQKKRAKKTPLDRPYL